MKSKIEKVMLGDSSVSDKEWERVVIDTEELLEALTNDNIRGFVREVLKPKYGQLAAFSSLVDDVTRSVLTLLVNTLQSGNKPSFALAVLISPTRIQRAEKDAQTLIATSSHMNYWRGQ